MDDGPGGRVFVIPDIHGCLDTLLRLLVVIDYTGIDQLVFLGDYINKGPDSPGTLNHLIELRQAHPDWIFLRGNHDQMLLDFWKSESQILREKLIRQGSAELLSARARFSAFLESTSFYHLWDQYIFVHAGLNFDRSNPLQDRQAMLQIRKIRYDPAKVAHRIIVHGHVPFPIEHISAMLSTGAPVLPLDNGCVYPTRPGHGSLTCLELPAKKLWRVPFRG